MDLEFKAPIEGYSVFRLGLVFVDACSAQKNPDCSVSNSDTKVEKNANLLHLLKMQHRMIWYILVLVCVGT